jgi:hypothetical protein
MSKRDFEGYNPDAEYALRVKHAHEQRFIEALLKLEIIQVLGVAKFSGWFLLVTGATFPLLLSNTTNLLQLVSVTSLRLVLLTLVISALAGLFVKFRAFAIAELRDSYEVVIKDLNELTDAESREHERIATNSTALNLEPPDIRIDFRNVLAQLQGVRPKAFRQTKKDEADFEATSDDRLVPLKRAVRLGYGVKVAFFVQVGTFLAAPLIVVWL